MSEFLVTAWEQINQLMAGMIKFTNTGYNILA